jgi:hypothetical protein
MKTSEIFEAMGKMPSAERGVFIENIHALDTELEKIEAGGVRSTKTTAESVDAALSTIAGMNGPLRRAITDALTARGIVSAAAEFNGGRTTIKQLSASAGNTSRLKLLRAEAARLGVALAEGKPIDLVALDAQLKGKNLERRWQFKVMLRQLSLI